MRHGRPPSALAYHIKRIRCKPTRLRVANTFAGKELQQVLRLVRRLEFQHLLDQAASPLGIAKSTADADWAYASSWLRLELEDDSVHLSWPDIFLTDFILAGEITLEGKASTDQCGIAVVSGRVCRMVWSEGKGNEKLATSNVSSSI